MGYDAKCIMRLDTRTVIGWLLSLFLAYEFVLSGVAKLTSKPRMIESFHTFGYPLWFMYFTGCLEVLCAILVLVPRFAVIGAGLLACVMLGAIYSHLTHGQADEIRMPLVLLAAAFALALLRTLRPAPHPAV